VRFDEEQVIGFDHLLEVDGEQLISQEEQGDIFE